MLLFIASDVFSTSCCVSKCNLMPSMIYYTKQGDRMKCLLITTYHDRGSTNQVNKVL